jgi:hypothetical protein
MAVLSTVEITSKANSPYGKPSKKLVEACVTCVPSTPPNTIKVITHVQEFEDGESSTLVAQSLPIHITLHPDHHLHSH